MNEEELLDKIFNHEAYNFYGESFDAQTGERLGKTPEYLEFDEDGYYLRSVD